MQVVPSACKKQVLAPHQDLSKNGDHPSEKMCPDSMDFSRHKGASGIYWIVPLWWGMVADGYQPGSSWRACPFISQWCGHNLKKEQSSKKVPVQNQCRTKAEAPFSLACSCSLLPGQGARGKKKATEEKHSQPPSLLLWSLPG
jgi:hypothetical protein